jgi:hypothetical protein
MSLEMVFGGVDVVSELEQQDSDDRRGKSKVPEMGSRPS